MYLLSHLVKLIRVVSANDEDPVFTDLLFEFKQFTCTFQDVINDLVSRQELAMAKVIVDYLKIKNISIYVNM